MDNFSKVESMYSGDSALNAMPPSLAAVPNTLTWRQNQSLRWFLLLFLFRYVRVFVNTISFMLYRPTPVPEKPSYHASNVTVVLATTNLSTSTFHNVVRSVLSHQIARLIITTGGPSARSQIPHFSTLFSDSRIITLHRATPNRREQVAMAMKHISTPLLILSDDHTFWPSSAHFLPSLLAPFEDPQVGAVGPILRARHHHHPLSFRGFWNFMGMMYLERRARELLATNSIDGGVSCLGGGFAVFRSCIYTSPEFLGEYLNEYMHWFGKRIGPLNADDDKFHTRWLANHGWKIKIQGSPETVMTTELGEWPKFMEQCLRWARTGWRSNPRALFKERVSWYRFPYTTYAGLLYSFVRMSLFYEIAMFALLYRVLEESGRVQLFRVAASVLGLWVLGMWFVKLFPYFRKYPLDVVYLPGYLLFAYSSSFIKVWALLTCGNDSWGTTSSASVYSDKSLVEHKENTGEDGKVEVKCLERTLALLA